MAKVEILGKYTDERGIVRCSKCTSDKDIGGCSDCVEQKKYQAKKKKPLNK